MKYYIDKNGKYLGGSDNTPLSTIEVANPPKDAREIWDGTQWNKPAPTKQEIIKSIKSEAQARIISLLPNGTPDNFIIKELNLMMRNANLDDIVINGGQLTTSQILQKNAFRKLKTDIRSIRSISKTARQAGDSLAKFKADLTSAGY